VPCNNIRGYAIRDAGLPNCIKSLFACVTGKNNQRVLYVHITKALYGLIVSAIMLFYKTLAADLVKYVFVINTYDPCVANKYVQDSQLAVSWHFDGLKVSHKSSAVVDSFLA
jgi:hypothetical protein